MYPSKLTLNAGVHRVDLWVAIQDVRGLLFVHPWVVYSYAGWRGIYSEKTTATYVSDTK